MSSLTKSARTSSHAFRKINNRKRLEAVESTCLMDSPPEPIFDELTQLAAAYFHMPLVYISILDQDRQYLKSHVGMGVRQSNLGQSFCAHTLAHDGTMVVPDTHEDERFRCKPLVTGEVGIRFYAGAPIVCKQGYKLGTFCILDKEPQHEFGAEGVLALERFAEITSRIIEERVLRREIRFANDRYVSATRASRDGLFDLDCRSGMVSCSAWWNKTLGQPAVDTQIDLRQLLRRIHPDDFHRFTSQWKVARTSRRLDVELECRCRHDNGSWRWLRTRLFCKYGKGGVLLRITGAGSDITASRMLDPLTGVHNRTSLLEHLQWRIDRKRDFRRSFGLLFVDLDNFKRVNDSLGHSMGDVLLVEVAQRMQSSIANAGNSLVARMGGDEFAVLIDDIATLEDLLSYSQLLGHLLGAAVDCAGHSVFPSASVGVVFGGDGEYTRAHQLLEDADVAMYRAKLRGKSQHALFSQRMREESRDRLQLEGELRQVLQKNELEVWYQPKFVLSCGRLKGFEALVRWRHPQRGLVSPLDFIPIAEETGIIVELGRWVASEAMAQLGRWRQQHIIPTDASMAVNVSPGQFRDASLLDFFRKELAKNALTPACLTIEVTESLLVQDSISSLTLLQAIVDAGIGLDLDDFGTGYSSLSYLHRFPFRCVKIDRAFTARMTTDPNGVALVSSIVDLVQSLNMDVVAEGVETEEQARQLLSMGCNAAQGYLFSPPRPAREIERYLRERVRPEGARVPCAPAIGARPKWRRPAALAAVVH